MILNIEMYSATVQHSSVILSGTGIYMKNKSMEEEGKLTMLNLSTQKWMTDAGSMWGKETAILVSFKSHYKKVS